MNYWKFKYIRGGLQTSYTLAVSSWKTEKNKFILDVEIHTNKNVIVKFPINKIETIKNTTSIITKSKTVVYK